jgi:hypothetical protein
LNWNCKCLFMHLIIESRVAYRYTAFLAARVPNSILEEQITAKKKENKGIKQSAPICQTKRRAALM